MITNESLPLGSFSGEDIDFLHDLEESMRPKATIQRRSEQMLRDDPDIYRLVSDKSAELAPGDPLVHSFYFTEFVLLYESVKNASKM